MIEAFSFDGAIAKLKPKATVPKFCGETGFHVRGVVALVLPMIAKGTEIEGEIMPDDEKVIAIGFSEPVKGLIDERGFFLRLLHFWAFRPILLTKPFVSLDLERA